MKVLMTGVSCSKCGSERVWVEKRTVGGYEIIVNACHCCGREVKVKP